MDELTKNEHGSALDAAVLVIPMFNEGTVIADVVALAAPGSPASSASTTAARTDAMRSPGPLAPTSSVTRSTSARARPSRPASPTHFGTRRSATSSRSTPTASTTSTTRRRWCCGPSRTTSRWSSGSRFLGSAESMSGSRRALLRSAVRFTRMTTGLRLTDAHNGLRVLRRDAAQEIKLRLPGMSHASEILTLVARHGWSYAEHPVSITYTDYSRAKGQRGYNALNIVFELAVNRLRAVA